MRRATRPSRLCWAYIGIASLPGWAQTVSASSTAAQRLGTVSGTISNAVTGVPVPAASLSLDSEDYAKRFAAGSDAAGRYAFRLIEPGRYYLKAECDGFVLRYFGDRDSPASRRPVLVEAGRELTQIDIPLMPTGTISGRVEDDLGRPIARAQLRLLRSAARRDKVEWVESPTGNTTDDRGEYRLFHLAPGRYIIQVIYPEDRNLRLALPASSVPPARPSPRLAYVPTYYPGTIAAKDAVTVEVAPGQERGGIDIRLARVPVASIRGHVIDEATGRPPRAFVMPFLRRLDEPGSILASPRYDPATSGFEFPLLPAGRYQLSCSQENKRAREVVELSGVDVDGLNVVLHSGSPVRGRVAKRADIGCDRFGELSWSEIQMGLSRIADDSDNYSAATKADGSFEFQEVPPGEYRLRFWDPQSHCYVQSASLAGAPAAENTVVVPPGGLTDLEVVPGAVGSIVGVVRDQQGKAVAGAHVICIDRDRSTGGAVAVCGPAGTDQEGIFELKSLVPGEVRLVALGEFDPDSPALHSLDGVLSRSQVVRVEENKKQTVELELISISK